MRAVPSLRTCALAGLLVATIASIWAAAAGGVTPTPGCPSFATQAEAQERFFLLGGTPSRNAGGWDGDGDGVACEGLSGPYAGFATIGYHRERKFLYGVASMPPDSAGGFACLAGNRHYPEGPRLLKVYKALPGPDRAVSRDVGAEARPDSGRLLWKLDRDPLIGGRYYIVFEEKIRPGPFTPSSCPEFRSREVYLPRPPRATPSPRSESPHRPPPRAPAPR